MKLYLLEDDQTVRNIEQLLKVNAECAALQWSQTMRDIPEDVREALDVIEVFVEGRLAQYCNQENAFETLGEAEEDRIMTLISGNPALRSTLGTGVVRKGQAAEEVKELLGTEPEAAKLIKAINMGKNVVMI